MDQSWEHINRSQRTWVHGNWGWGRAIPRKRIHKWGFRCSVSYVENAIFRIRAIRNFKSRLLTQFSLRGNICACIWPTSPLRGQLRRPGANWRKFVCKVVGAIVVFTFNHVEIRKSGLVNRYRLGFLAVYFEASAKTQLNFENWQYFRKKISSGGGGSTRRRPGKYQGARYFRSFDVQNALFKTPCLNHTFMFPYKLDAVFVQFFCKKLRVPPLVDTWPVPPKARQDIYFCRSHPRQK